MVDSAIFWVFSLLSITAALGAVLNRSIINAALCLIAVFLGIAGFFMLNNADFLAIAQIIIYAVGLTIIMLFAIMFTGDKPMAQPKVSKVARIASGIIIFYTVALLIRMAFQVSAPESAGHSGEMIQTFATQGSTTLLGKLLFTTYALPFEVASILLLAAMIGAIVIAKKRFFEEGEAPQGVRLELDMDSAPPEAVIAELRAKRQGGSTTDTRLAPHVEIGGLPPTSPVATVGTETKAEEQ